MIKRSLHWNRSLVQYKAHVQWILLVRMYHQTSHTVEPLWKGQEYLTKVVKFGTFQCTLLHKSCLFYPSWQATYFERPPSRGWLGLWGFLWWAPSAKGKDHHGVSSGWSSVWHRSNTGLSSTQYEQIPIILGVWPFWLTPFFFRSITFWRAYG